MLFNLTINNFRNLSDATYTFNRGVTLLKGVSGTGKTTIFAAIDWCFYGKGKNVKPLKTRKSRKTETTVTFNSDSLTITRKNNPETLNVILDNEEYKDNEAQIIINSIFGNRDKFFILSYIEQKKYTKFFELKDSDKLDFLNKLSYEEDKVNDFKAKLDSELSNIKSKYNSEESIYNFESKKLENVNVDIPNIERKDIDELKSSKQEIIEIIKFNEKYINEYNSDRRILDDNTDILNRKETEFNSLEEVNEKEILSFENKIIKLKETRNQLNTKNSLEYKLNEKKKIFNNIYNEYKFDDIDFRQEYTEEQINSQIHIEEKIKDNIKLCRELKINYYELNEDQLNEMKNKVESHERYNQYIILENDLSEKKRQLSLISIDKDIYEKLSNEINNLNLKIKELENELIFNKDYVCPKCEEILFLDKGQLIQIDEVTKDRIKNKNNIQNQIKLSKESIDNKKIYFEQLSERINRYNHLEEEIKDKSRLITKLYPIIPEKIISDINKSILNRIELVKSNGNPSSQYMKDFNLIKNISKDIKYYQHKIKSLNIDQVLLSEIDKIEQYEKKLEKDKNIIIRRRILFNDIIKFKNKISNINIDEDKFKKISSQNLSDEKKLKEIEEKIILFEKYCSINEIKKNIKDKEVLMKEYTSDIQALNDLKKNIYMLECKYLNSTINKINHYINIFLRRLFVDTINVNITLMKSKITLKINKDGVEYPDISYLSGGELDRISFIFSLTLNFIYNWSFIILDEVFASLDIDLRTKSIELIKELQINTMIISHDEIEGFYDDVISL